jgi:hypothetical protein
MDPLGPATQNLVCCPFIHDLGVALDPSYAAADRPSCGGRLADSLTT